MEAPIISTITLFTELIITALILYIFHSGYKKSKFPFKIALFAVLYEVIFNISYMVYRSVTHEHTEIHSSFHVALAIFHGIISLVMFIALVIYLAIAWKKYRKDINFFKQHKIITIVFLVLWLIAVISGILFYFVAYF